MRASVMLGWSASLFAALWAGATGALLQSVATHEWFWKEPELVAFAALFAFVATMLAAWWVPIVPARSHLTRLKTAIASSLIFSFAITGTVLIGIFVESPRSLPIHFLLDRLTFGLIAFPMALIASLPCSAVGALVFGGMVGVMTWVFCPETRCVG